MLTRLLELATRAVLERPLRVIVACAAPCFALALYGLTVPRDLSFTGVLNREHPLVASYYEKSGQLKFAGRMPLLLEGPDERLDEAARALVPVLEALPSVQSVTAELPTDWLRARAPFLVEPEVFDDWLRLATHPEDAAAPKRLAAAMASLEAEAKRMAPEGARLVVVRMAEDPMNLPAGGGPYLEIERATSEVLARFEGVTGSYAGLPAISAQDQSRTLGIVQLLSPISLVLVLLIFWLLEPRLSRIAAVALPMLLSIGATLGVVGALTGKLTVMETFFGVMVFGLGVDFAVLLLSRLREERAKGEDFASALKSTLTGSGRGVVAGGLTTAGAFTIVALAPDPLALHLGLSGGVGLFVCLALMLLLLPALWVLLDRIAPDKPEPRAVRLGLLDGVARHAARHPVIHVAACGLLLGGALLGVQRYHYETDLQKVFNRKVPALSTVERIQQIFRVNASPWIVVAKDLEEARDVAARFAREPMFERVDSAAHVLRSDAEQRRRRLEGARQDIAAQKITYEALIPLVSDDEARALKGAVAALGALDDALSVGPPTLDSLPRSLRLELFTEDGKPLVFAYVKEPTIDGLKAREERLAAQAIHADAVSFGFLLEAVMAAERPWAWWVFFGILAYVVVVLLVDFRSLRLSALALSPVIFSTGTTFGLLCWFDVGFNVLTTVVVPLIIGLGVDAGIHVVHRLREDREAAVGESAAAVGRAILMTTATTSVSFATLLFADHPGLEGMALVMLLGLPLCLWGSVTLLPALSVLTLKAAAKEGGP